MLALKENPIEGTEIHMGGLTIQVPALNMRQIKALAIDIKKIDQEQDVNEKFSAQMRVIHQAIRRNYPDATLEEIEDLVDMNNIAEVTMAVMGQTGLARSMGKMLPATP